MYLDRLKKVSISEDRNFDKYQDLIATYCKAGFHKEISFWSYFYFMVKVPILI